MINLPTKILLAIKPMRTQFKFTLRLICTPEYKYTPEYIYTRVFFAHANWTLVYKFKKLIGINDFPFQFRKIITRYRRIGYNLNVMRQSACLVFNPIMVDKYAAFFNCTPVDRASDSMMAPT